MSANDPFHHVRDAAYIELPQFAQYFWDVKDVVHDVPVWRLPKLNLLGYEFQITKYMMIEVIAAVLVMVIMRGLAVRAQSGKPVKGSFWNFWEAICLFLRDNVVRPSIGEPHHHGHADHGHAVHGHAVHGHGDHGHGDHANHDQGHGASSHGGDGHDPHMDGHAPAAAATGTHFADRFLPFIWTCFFFILFNNLLGAVPLLGSPTANTGLTAVLACSALIVTTIAGAQQSGFVGFLKALAPSTGVPGIGGTVLTVMLWIIEFAGLLIKHGVLAVRLFANIMAGHTVLGVFLSFIAIAANHGLVWYAVTPASIAAQVGIGCLELFVSFLQAYVFSLLASLFIGMAVHPH